MLSVQKIILKCINFVAFVGAIFFSGGCGENYISGGGGSIHIPPLIIRENEPITLKLELSVWGGGGNIKARYSKVICCYKINNKISYQKIKMDLIKSKPLTQEFSCRIPAEVVKKGTIIDYYFEMYLDNHYFRREEAPLIIK